jgi:hypothetical protein
VAAPPAAEGESENVDVRERHFFQRTLASACAAAKDTTVAELTARIAAFLGQVIRTQWKEPARNLLRERRDAIQRQYEDLGDDVAALTVQDVLAEISRKVRDSKRPVRSLTSHSSCFFEADVSHLVSGESCT